jgi:hypothetical protein
MNDMAAMCMEIAATHGRQGAMPINHIPGPEGVRGRNSNNDLIKQVCLLRACGDLSPHILFRYSQLGSYTLMPHNQMEDIRLPRLTQLWTAGAWLGAEYRPEEGAGDDCALDRCSGTFLPVCVCVCSYLSPGCPFVLISAVPVLPAWRMWSCGQVSGHAGFVTSCRLLRRLVSTLLSKIC